MSIQTVFREAVNSSLESLLSALLLLILLLLLYYSLFDSNNSHGLKGPSLWQFLPNGELFSMLRDSRNTLQTMLKLSDKYGQVFKTWVGPRKMVVTSNPADVVQILSSTGDFPRTDAQLAIFNNVIPGGLLTMPKDVHLVARKHLKDTFNFSMLQYCHSLLADAVSELCEEVEAKAVSVPFQQLTNPTNILPLLATASFRIIVSIVFGCEFSHEKRVELHDWVGQLMNELLKDFLGYPYRQGLSLLGSQNKLIEARTHLYAMCDSLISRRLRETATEMASRPADTLDAIISMAGKNSRSVISETMEFAIAGSHTISLTLAWCIYEICGDHRVEANILNEVDQRLSSKPLEEPLTLDDVERMSYIQKVWKETLRLHPPVAFLVRTTSREVALRGSQVKLQKGTHVMALVKQAQTSPSLWRAPKSFVPERWGCGTEKGEGDKVPSGSYVPFSSGQRSCIGKFLADHEGVLILAELYRRFQFTLACAQNEVISSTAWLEEPRYASVDGRAPDVVGVPVHIKRRSGDST